MRRLANVTRVRTRGAYNTEMGQSRALNRIAVAVLLVALGAAAASAQRRGRGRFFEPVRSPTPDTFQGAFNFCRVMFSTSRDGDGANWAVDYPRADVNLSIRLSELTKTRVSTDASGEPDHVVIELTDPALFDCPFVMMTEVGGAYIGPEEAVKLREYLQKGGFLWADDFWGSYAWEHWVLELSKVLPPNDYKIFELPKDHPLFRQQFQIAKVPQIASINFWMGSGGGTSERYEDSAVPHAMGVADRQGRLMVLMTHNTDFGDSWEREGDDPNYFYRFSVDGYAFGINVLLYAMSH
jgi:Domain of unknown function (DUF4159)